MGDRMPRFSEGEINMASIERIYQYLYVREATIDDVDNVIVTVREGYKKYGRLYANLVRKIFGDIVFDMRQADYLFDMDIEYELIRFVEYAFDPAKMFPLRVVVDIQTALEVCEKRLEYANKIGMTTIPDGNWSIWYHKIMMRCDKLTEMYGGFFTRALFDFVDTKIPPLVDDFLGGIIAPIQRRPDIAERPADMNEAQKEFHCQKPYAAGVCVMRVRRFHLEPTCGLLLATLENFLNESSGALRHLKADILPQCFSTFKTAKQVKTVRKQQLEREEQQAVEESKARINLKPVVQEEPRQFLPLLNTTNTIWKYPEAHAPNPVSTATTSMSDMKL